jgi:DNA-binding NarL/FixJ family response regulator
MQLLIIDSSVEIIQRLKELLSELDIIKTIHSSVSYETGIKQFREKKPAVVLLDICLPEYKSLQLLKDMKAFNYNSSFIVLSNSTTDYRNEMYKLMGADYFLDKYHDFEKIPTVIDAIANSGKKVKSF